MFSWIQRYFLNDLLIELSEAKVTIQLLSEIKIGGHSAHNPYKLGV
ncbi:MAG: hypothetical protein VSS52_002475 [Thiotrichaceae bacterium]|nr:hypothetical protein [Thiotrichaceae bacterium]